MIDRNKKTKSAKDAASSVLIDFSEPAADDIMVEAAKDFFEIDFEGIAETTPGLKAGVAIKRAADAGRQYLRHRQLVAFLKALHGQKADVSAFYDWSEDQKQYLRAFVIAELDKQTSEFQAEALAYLVSARQIGKIDHLIFTATGHEIKNINPLVFGFNISGFVLINEPQKGMIVRGPTNILPPIFIRVEEDSARAWLDMGTSVLSEMGVVFFEHVYNPMARKHTH